MKPEIGSLFSKIGSYYELNEEASGTKLLVNGTGALLTTLYDDLRISYRRLWVTSEDTLDPSSLRYKILNNTGDLLNGYVNTLIIYYGLGIVLPRLSERVRAGISFIIGAGTVVWAETNPPYPFMGSPDINDVPAGIIGSGLFIMCNFVGNRLADRFVQREISNS